nr:hypothetical protein [Kiritimatiellia bacterium]
PRYWGIYPSFLETTDDPEDNVSRAIAKLCGRGLLKKGNTVVAVTEVKIHDRLVDTIMMEQVEG